MELLSHSTRALIAVLALTTMLAAPAGTTATTPEYQFDIGIAPLTVALKEFARQTGLQFAYLDAHVSNPIVGPVRGRLSADAALRALLKSVAFAHEWVNPRTVYVCMPARDSGVTGTESPASACAGETERSEQREYRRSNASINPIEEVIVHESRLAAGVVTMSRIEVLDRQRVNELAVSSIADLLKHIAQQPYVRAEGSLVAGAQHADLRGMGPQATAILIDGRKTAASATSISHSAFDLTAVPLSAVERVEVLSEPPPSRYGADAMAGAVNLILKRHIPAPEITLRYGTARDGGAERQASVSAGLSRERVQATLVLDYVERDALLGIDRDRWRDQDHRRFGGVDWRAFASNPGNVSSINASNLPGLASTYVAVPRGSSGVALVPGDFSAGAGHRNLASLRRHWSILPQGNRASAVATGNLQFSDGYSGFGELIYSRRETTGEFDPAGLTGHLVPATNAFNPFDVPVVVDYLFVDIGPRRQVITSEVLRAVTGVRREWSWWEWELALLHSQGSGSSRLENQTDPLRVDAALSSSDPQQALNVFRDGPGGSPELLAALIAPPATTDYESKLAQVSGRVSGRPLQLPAGHVHAGMGVQAHVESVAVGGDSSSLTPLAYSREVLGVFSEWHFPLLAPSGAGSSGALSLSAAARMDRYTEFGHTFNPQFALTWQPFDDITLRATYGSTFRPPSLIELFGPRVEYPTIVPDARRNGELATVIARTGGNPDLLPSTARALAAEVTFRPEVAPALRMSAKYWQTSVQRRITWPAMTSLLQHERRFPGRTVRDEPTAADIVSGRPGRLLFLDLSRGNFGHLRMRGIDVQASYEFSTPAGELMPQLSAARMFDYLAADVPNDAPTQRVGIASSEGTLPKWRVLTSLGWRRGAVSATVAARFNSAYEDAIGSIRMGREVPSQTLVDVQATFDLGVLEPAPVWRGMKLTAGAKNLFDQEPPFSHVNLGEGFDSSQGDLEGRLWYVQLAKKL